MSILLIDNNDSFTYNLFQQLEGMGAETEVLKVGDLDVEECAKFEAFVISPGPKSPKDYPIYTQLLDRFHKVKPILGVCLGHQILGEYFGSQTQRAPRVMHGKVSLIQHTGLSLFQGIENPMKVARYHSLIVNEAPSNFTRLAWTDDELLMAMEHESLSLFGVQFHPESFLTEHGNTLIQNFLKRVDEHSKR